MQILVGTVIFAAALFVWWTGSLLPEQVASQFGLTGRADGHMSRDGFIASMMVVVVVPGVTWMPQLVTARRGKSRIPHRGIWFGAPHAASTVRFLEQHAAWFTVAIVVFMAILHWLVVKANVAAGTPARLDTMVFLAVLGVFFAFAVGWTLLPLWRFGKPPAGGRHHR